MYEWCLVGHDHWFGISSFQVMVLNEMVFKRGQPNGELEWEARARLGQVSNMFSRLIRDGVRV